MPSTLRRSRCRWSSRSRRRARTCARSRSAVSAAMRASRSALDAASAASRAAACRCLASVTAASSRTSRAATAPSFSPEPLQRRATLEQQSRRDPARQADLAVCRPVVLALARDREAGELRGHGAQVVDDDHVGQRALQALVLAEADLVGQRRGAREGHRRVAPGRHHQPHQPDAGALERVEQGPLVHPAGHGERARELRQSGRQGTLVPRLARDAPGEGHGAGEVPGHLEHLAAHVLHVAERGAQVVGLGLEAAPLDDGGAVRVLRLGHLTLRLDDGGGGGRRGGLHGAERLPGRRLGGGGLALLVRLAGHLGVHRLVLRRRGAPARRPAPPGVSPAAPRSRARSRAPPRAGRARRGSRSRSSAPPRARPTPARARSRRPPAPRPAALLPAARCRRRAPPAAPPARRPAAPARTRPRARPRRAGAAAARRAGARSRAVRRARARAAGAARCARARRASSRTSPPPSRGRRRPWRARPRTPREPRRPRRARRGASAAACRARRPRR